HFASIISGIPGHDIEDVQLNNIRIYYRQMDSAQNKIPFVVPEHEKAYPEPAKMGMIPAYGFFIRHAKDIQLNNVEVGFLGTETRPAFVINEVKGITITGIKAQAAPAAKKFILKNVYNFRLQQSGELKDRNYKKVDSTSF
ncbi:MAG: hypothetical protein ABIN97_17195, partial [Ginsengibacter sp.]